MSAQTPMGKDASLILQRGPLVPHVLQVSLNDGNEGFHPVARARSTHPNDEERFRWLVGSAASFHKIPVEDLTQ